MTGHFAQRPRDRGKLRLSVSGGVGPWSHMVHDSIGPGRGVRLLGIVHCWIPNSLENRCHILVQTCLIFCHYLSFRANIFFVVCTLVRRGISTREKMRMKQLRPSFFSTPFSPHQYNGFPSKCQKQNSGIPLIFRPISRIGSFILKSTPRMSLFSSETGKNLPILTEKARHRFHP